MTSWGQERMIKMNRIQQILMMYTQEGKSCRAIARLVGMNRETVGKHFFCNTNLIKSFLLVALFSETNLEGCSLKRLPMFNIDRNLLMQDKGCGICFPQKEGKACIGMV